MGEQRAVQRHAGERPGRDGAAGTGQGDRMGLRVQRAGDQVGDHIHRRLRPIGVQRGAGAYDHLRPGRQSRVGDVVAAERDRAASASLAETEAVRVDLHLGLARHVEQAAVADPDRDAGQELRCIEAANQGGGRRVGIVTGIRNRDGTAMSRQRSQHRHLVVGGDGDGLSRIDGDGTPGATVSVPPLPVAVWFGSVDDSRAMLAPARWISVSVPRVGV